MTTELERFDIWAPEGGRWSLWAKPILFDGLSAGKTHGTTPTAWKPVEAGAYRTPVVPLDEAEPGSGAVADSALVIDLPGDESIEVALDAAAAGYRPVPLYAACTAPGEIVPQYGLREAVIAATARLHAQRLALDAPPAFLLDSRRMQGGSPAPREFDNRWQVFPQDFPSAWKLLHHGIKRVIVIMREPVPSRDLLHVLIRWQKAGISLSSKPPDNSASVSLANLPTPGDFYFPWFRAAALIQLRPSWSGGFGGYVPEPSKG